MPFKMISLFPINMITDRPRGRDDLRTQRREREKRQGWRGDRKDHKRLPVHEMSSFQ